jgi:hypothetical protein
MLKYFVLQFSHGTEMNEPVSGMPAPNSGRNLRECEDQSWLKLQAVPVFRFECCKMFSRTPG